VVVWRHLKTWLLLKGTLFFGELAFLAEQNLHSSDVLMTLEKLWKVFAFDPYPVRMK
jgi:hypothetical protein